MLAALYDIHGNLPALEAVLRDVRAAGVDHIVVGGDIFPGPLAREALETLRTLDIPVTYVRGNGDRNLVEVAGRRQPVGLPEPLVPLFEWHANQLDPRAVAAIAQWPLTVTLSGILFCHATPRDDNEFFTQETPSERIAAAFEGISSHVVICGHSHRQFERQINDVRVVNAGSVGMPFDGTDARWLLLGETIQLRRTTYDLADAARRVEASDYPRKSEFMQIAFRTT